MRKNPPKSHRSRRSLSVGFLVGFFLLFSFSVLWAQEIRTPKVGLIEDMFDFKEVLEGEIITHAFTIQNKGNETLKILQVKPG